MSRVLFKVQLLTTMKQASLNSTKLLSKYKDMLDPLDPNSVAKAKQINLRKLSSLPTLNYKNLAIISFVLLCVFVQQCTVVVNS